jgi:glycosyltransferase involved in cell wall biosynthesis/Flp pilus assembly protein TadD
VTRRFLFGPVPAAWAEDHLPEACGSGRCLPFGPDDTWASLAERFPPGWRPDFVALHLAYRRVHPSLWEAPVPLVALAEDWNLLWHYYRRVLPACDVVLTDAAGVDVCRRAGVSHARPADLFGLPRSFLAAAPAAGERDIDVLFVGNLHPAVQRERLAWMGRLARLAEGRRVLIATGIFGDDYRELLRRSRIVFNRSVRGECNLRTFEATASGALLFQEAGNREVARHFADRRECVFYREDDLEGLLEYYLTHEDERRALADAGQRRAQRCSFEALWDAALSDFDPAPTTAAGRGRPRLEGRELLHARTLQAVNSSQGADPALAADLAAALAARPDDARLHNLLGLAAALGGAAARDRQAAEHFRRAVLAPATTLPAALNLIEAFVALGEGDQAAEGARRTLGVLERVPDAAFAADDGPHYPPAFDLFRVEWERAAWENAGDAAGEARAKRDLVRWRLHALLAELTGELWHHHEAALARPDLPATRAALGCALGRAKQPAAAAMHLRRAVDANPFDAAAARALFQALRDASDAEGQERLARERRLLRRAAPEVVAAEGWFAGVPAPEQPGGPCRVAWEGPLRAAHSLGLVNRELCRALLRRGHELSLLPADPPLPAQDLVPLDAALAGCVGRPLSGPADAHVRLRWPPDPAPPPAGRWVVQQPWEFGSIPRAWLDFLADQVDEVWAPSRFVRDCFVQSGVPADRVHVVPYGVDPARFRPGAPPLPLKTRKRFKFLFVGGTLRRKGIDILLGAYARAFTRADDVCLVVKDMGVGTFYRGQTAEELIGRLRADDNAPEVEYLAASLDEEALPGLYTACDCLVQPYRGEGFGLPILEALACGLPVVVTGYGPALDFCDDRCAYLLPARLVRFPDKRVGDLETVDHPWLAEPDAGVLRDLLRHVTSHPDEARALGEAGRQRAHAEFTWDRAAAAAAARLHALRQQPIRRAERVVALAAPAATGKQPRVSLCMIVKDEEHNLPACLASVADLVDEVVVVDTGSTDKTKEVAARFNAKVVDFPWVDSFAAARNECLRHATGEWVFWLDADDRLDEENRRKLRSLFAGLGGENAAYAMKCLCLPDAATGTATVVDHVRLFRNHPAVRWEYRVHEQILPAIRKVGGEVRWADVVVHHAGYQDPALRGRKLQRDLRLLQLEDADRPDDPFTLFNLGSVYQELGRHAEALPLLQRSLAKSHPQDSIVRKLYALVVQCHRNLGQPAEALAACHKGLEVCPDDAELLFVEGVLRRELGDLPGAEAALLKLFDARPAAHFASVDAGLRGYKARHNLAVVYLQQGRTENAEVQWRAAVAERPDFLPGWLGLAEMRLRQGRWGELDEVVRRLEGLSPRGAVEAEVLRARGHLARREFDPARALLAAVIARHPQALEPRVVLSHVLLQEGRDPDAAEQALRDVLALDPQHAEARSNLSVLLLTRPGGR